MPWILVDLLLALVALVLLGLLALRLWRTVKRLSATVSVANEKVATATAALDTAMAAGPLGGDVGRSSPGPDANRPDPASGA